MGFIPNKENILTYWKIILESSPKSEIFKYIFKRLIGIRANFNDDVYINNGEAILNCGKLINNCTVACSQFEKEMLPLISNTKVAVDVGANIGRHTLAMAKTGGIVFAIEPDKDSMKLLKQNISINKMESKIKIIQKACSFEPGIATFYRDPIYPTSNSITIKKNETMIEENVEVDTIDNICSGYKVDLIKVDVEGGELNALKGATKVINTHHPKIIFEAWNKDAANEIIDYLIPLGYKTNKIDEFNYLAICGDDF